ncbi:MAG: hypothetical protein HDS79_06505 [Bacteroidales bacterium]|nr:hypothetical protein [Bacteroidales bacterium]
MMKKVLTLTMAAMALFSTGAMAQTAAKGGSEVAKKECTQKDCKDKKDCKSKKDCKGDKACKDGKARKGGKDFKGRKGQSKDSVMFNPMAAFDGIQLTDAQKAGLQTLNQKRAESRKAMKEQMAAARKDRKDSAKVASREDREKMIAARKAAQKEYFEQVKAIIGPDNYVVFLENMVMNGPAGKHQMKKGPKAAHHAQASRKGDRKDRKGQKGDKSQKGQRTQQMQASNF